MGLEQLDVVTGLLDYADQGMHFIERLGALYQDLPEDWRPWGPRVTLPYLQDLAVQLRAAASEL